MAAELGFCLATVSAWERGERFPDIFALGLIIRYTHVTPCRLFCDRCARCEPGQCLFLNVRA